MLQPRKPGLARERILMYGEYGSGKSNGWTSVADMYRRTSTPGHFYVLETIHEASLVVLEPYDNWEQNVSVMEVSNFEEALEASQKIREQMTPDDWFVTEMVSFLLPWSRDLWFREHREGMGWREHLHLGKADLEVKSHHWQEMDDLHRAWTNPYVVNCPGNVYATAQADNVRTEQGFSDNKAVIKMFQRFGVKAVGHNQLGWVFRSVLLCKHPTKDEWTLTTVDDPGRVQLEDETVAGPPLGFVKSYLMDVAGWTIT